LTKKPVTAAVAGEAINRALLDAGLAIVGEPTPDGGNRASVDDRAHEHNADGGRIATVDELARVVDDALATQREQTFPLAPFATGSAAVEAPPAPDLSNYATALAAADQQAARLTPVLDALLAVGDYAALDEPVQCPVCGTEHALTADRVALLREHLQQTQAVDGAARAAARALGDARRDLDQVAADAERAGPRVAGWSNEQHDRADEMLGALGIDSELLSGARSAGRALADAAEGIVQAITLARAAVDDATRAVASRDALPGQLADRYSQVARTVQALAAASQPYSGAVAVLRGAIDTATRDRVTVRGLTELADLLSGRGELVSDVVAEAARQSTIKRITAGARRPSRCLTPASNK
jgi:hypothetical protein